MISENISSTSNNHFPFLDKSSKYYRVCPECKMEFMANDMRRKFCSDKCGDDFNNAKKKQTKPVIESIPIQEKPEQEGTATQPVHTPLEKNLDILNNLSIDHRNGSYFHLEYLLGKGYEFGTYTGKGKLYNIPDEYNCHFLQVGEYRLYLTGNSTTLIVKTKNS